MERLVIMAACVLIGALFALSFDRPEQPKLPPGSCAQQVAECVRLGGWPNLGLRYEFTCTKTVKVMP